MALKKSLAFLLLAAPVLVLGFRNSDARVESRPAFTGDGHLKFPEQYRQWVYLSSGFDMSYNPAVQAAGSHTFDNVFVNPEAYRSFLESGTWPDTTMLVLENRTAIGKGSINQSGNYQSMEVTGLEIHVKDSARFPRKWAFFGFGKNKLGTLIPPTASCYSCHAEHAAVDTTFAQFYPTLFALAKSKATLSSAYLKEVAAEQK